MHPAEAERERKWKGKRGLEISPLFPALRLTGSAAEATAVSVAASATAEEQKDDPDAAVAEDTVTTVVIVAAGIIVAATVCSS